MPIPLPLLSIVCPAYREEDVLPLFHAELTRVLAALQGSYRIEIIYVDDGSDDGTLKAMRELAATDERVRYFSLSRNFGHQAALTAGLEHARGDVVITMDSDLQHPPRLIPELLAKWEQGEDIVLTIRADDKRLSLWKRYSSKLFYIVMALISDTDIRDAASDFRLMSRRAVHALLQLKERHRLLRGMVRWLGYRTTEIPFEPDVRKAGTTKYTLARMISLASEGMFSFSRLPLRLASYLGVLAILVGLGNVVWYLLALLTGVSSLGAGMTYVVVSMHLLCGAVLCTVGVLGEYLGRVFEQVKDRPLYLIKETSPGEDAALAPAFSSLPHRHRDAA
ncbi:MAG TPA: glycosyltransferase family 2 protein [Gemmataceae bacterium]|nr:glycosyltransferase family 2 protein [Gemmataceae bacterium]